MIRFVIYDEEDHEQNYPAQGGSRILKPVRNAYLTAEKSNSNWDWDWDSDSDAWDNQKAIQKYYPKKISYVYSIPNTMSVFNLTQFPDWLHKSIKSLKSLKTKYLRNINRSAHSLKNLEIAQGFDPVGDLDKPYDIKNALRASKRLETLSIRNKIVMFRDIMYLPALRSLDLSITDEKLPKLKKTILNLKALETLSLLFFIPSSKKYQDSGHFLRFFEEVLKKTKLKRLSIDFETYDHYSSNNFEELFKIIEHSKLEEWTLQVMLVEDEVLGMAEKYRVFREAKHIAIHNKNSDSDDDEGIMAKYFRKTKFQERSPKMLNIWLCQNLEEEESHSLDLGSILTQCPNIEHFHFRGDCFLMDRHIQKQFLSLRTLTYHIPKTNQNFWGPLIQILANTPLLEKFSLKLSFHLDDQSDYEYRVVQAFIEKLSEVKSLKSVDLKLPGASQQTLDILESFFENRKGLKNLSFNIKKTEDVNFTLPRSLINNFTDLTELQLHMPYAPTKLLKNLIEVVPEVHNLQLFRFKNAGRASVHWTILHGLMQNLTHLSKLRKFRFSSKTEIFPGESEEEEDEEYEEEEEKYFGKGLVSLKKGLNNLITSCHELEFAKLKIGILLEYNKYPKFITE